MSSKPKVAPVAHKLRLLASKLGRKAYHTAGSSMPGFTRPHSWWDLVKKGNSGRRE